MRNLNDLSRIARQLNGAVSLTRPMRTGANGHSYYRDAKTGRYIATPYTLTELAFFRKAAE